MFHYPNSTVEYKAECQDLKCDVPHSECVLTTDNKEVCICSPNYAGDPNVRCEGLYSTVPIQTSYG